MAPLDMQPHHRAAAAKAIHEMIDGPTQTLKLHIIDAKQVCLGGLR